MSVLVSGMKMPKGCLWCPMQYLGFCQVTKNIRKLRFGQNSR